MHYTIAATNALASIEAQVITDEPNPVEAGAGPRRPLLGRHAGRRRPDRDGSATIVENLAYPDATGYLTLDPGSYDLKVCASADNNVCPLDPGAPRLEGGRAYSVFAIGSLDGGSLTAVVTVDAMAALHRHHPDPGARRAGRVARPAPRRRRHRVVRRRAPPGHRSRPPLIVGPTPTAQTRKETCHMRRLVLGITSAAIAASVIAAPALAASPGAKPGSSTIVEIVLAPDGEFDVLQAAVVKAGLVGALNSTDHQYTVFAPTDAAFVGTFEGLLQADLTEQDVIGFINAGGVDAAFGDDALADILLYHVTNGRRTSKSVLVAPRYQMLNGDKLTRGELLDAGVIATNIPASNGVIHVIGSVLLP
jgi:uncharacterized surface protein with fasciclin (FAS1) repeats